MGGGPASADVVRASCILTFPEATGEEPVPVDAWYLHAVGLPFLRRLARDRVGDAMRIALIMQTNDGEHGKRYTAVSSQSILRSALEDTFDHPEHVLVLHIVALDKVRGLKTIHVRPEINPNVSPEPVAPLALVFPTLSVSGVMTPTAVVVPTAEPTATPTLAYELMSQSSFNFRKSVDLSGPSVAKSLADSSPFIEERDYTRQSTSTVTTEGSLSDLPSESSISPSSSSVQLSTESVGSSISQTAKRLDDEEDENIPVARVVGASNESVASSIPSDYVMLELQNGAGLPDVPSETTSTFFISSNWAAQAEEMSASMRLEPLNRSAQLQRQSQEERVSGGSLEDSFVVLDGSQA